MSQTDQQRAPEPHCTEISSWLRMLCPKWSKEAPNRQHPAWSTKSNLDGMSLDVLLSVLVLSFPSESESTYFLPFVTYQGVRENRRREGTGRIWQITPNTSKVYNVQ